MTTRPPVPDDRSLWPADLDRLAAFLGREPQLRTAMSVPMIDGFLTALVVGPNLVMPCDYIPWIWDFENGEQSPDIRDEAEATDLYTTITTGMQNRVATGLMEEPPSVVPLFVLDERWSYVEWAQGFEIGTTFDADAWNEAIDADPELYDVIEALHDPELKQTLGLDWDELLADLSEAVVVYRNVFRAAALAAHTPFSRDGPKVGRNDPCPCGSGKKYKKCCGQ
jgi:uncharacterized protein